MKKVLAIVLALAMVLCMIPAVAADKYITISIADKAYRIVVHNAADYTGDTLGSAAKANSVTAKYDYSKIAKISTGRWTDEKAMAIIAVDDFTKDLTNAAILIDGKALSVADDASYKTYTGYNKTTGSVLFPVELTKGGYTDTFVITLTGKNGDGDLVNEVAKISVKLIDTSVDAKAVKTAYITDIQSLEPKVATVYIVGSKIYADYVDKTATDLPIKITFADENAKAFSVITYAQKTGKGINLDSTLPEVKLVKSATNYKIFPESGDDTNIVFALDTKDAYYETKKYALVVRKGIVEEDPKGLYFEKSEVTIAVGEEYTPVVKGLANGKSYKATLIIYADAKQNSMNTDVIDYADLDHEVIIGTKPGVAYIAAAYEPAGGIIRAAGCQKITVVNGSQIPPATTTYYVTCRNLNVRKGPGTSYAKAGMIHRGDAVEVVEIAKGWAKLANGTYVSANYIAK